MKRFSLLKTLRVLLATGAIGTVQAISTTAASTAATPAEGRPSSTPRLRDLQSFFDNNCVACHLEGGQNGGLVLEEGRAYKNLVGAMSTGSGLHRVEPGDPEKSYLMHKLRGTQASVGGGARMPLGGAPVDQATLGKIEAWIRAGAPD